MRKKSEAIKNQVHYLKSLRNNPKVKFLFDYDSDNFFQARNQNMNLMQFFSWHLSYKALQIKALLR